MIEYEDISYHYGSSPVLKHIDFSVETGQSLAILGKSGSGKSTLIQLLNGLLALQSGRILIDGRPHPSYKPIALKRQMGYVLQEKGLFEHMTVERNLTLLSTLLKIPANTTTQRIEELLTLLQLDQGVLSCRPSELSGGQQQRIAIARALVHKPAVLLLDEAFSALDPITRVEILIDFKHLIQREQVTLVFVTHHPDEAFYLADQVLLLQAGTVQQCGPPASFLKAPANPFVRAFLRADRIKLDWMLYAATQCIDPFTAPESNIHAYLKQMGNG